MRRFMAVIIGCLALALAPAAVVAQGQGGQTQQGTLLSQNPLLADVARTDPDALPNLVARLLAITAGTQVSRSRTSAPATDAEGQQIFANPALAQAYQHDQAGTLVLLRETNEALRKARQGALANQPKRLALVIGTTGNSAWGNLPNTASDARLVVDTLRKLNFEIVQGGSIIDPDKPHLNAAVVEFGHKIGPDTVALFYYAGHGVQLNGENYLVPQGAELPRTTEDVEKSLIDVGDAVLKRMQQANGRLNIAILDACRDHPPLQALAVASRGAQRDRQGLTEPNLPPAMNGTVIIYSTAPNDVARDGIGNDKNSPFAKAFAASVVVPGDEMRDAFEHMQEDVKAATSQAGRAQQPWISYAAVGKFYFAGLPSSAVPNLGTQGIPAPDSATVVFERLKLAEEQCTALLSEWTPRIKNFEMTIGFFSVVLTPNDTVFLNLRFDEKARPINSQLLKLQNSIYPLQQDYFLKAMMYRNDVKNIKLGADGLEADRLANLANQHMADAVAAGKVFLAAVDQQCGLIHSLSILN